MQFNGVNNKERLRSLVASSVDANMHLSEFHVLVDCRTVQRMFLLAFFIIALVF